MLPRGGAPQIVPDLKCVPDIERVPDKKRYFQAISVRFTFAILIIVSMFIKTRSSSFFGTMGSFLIIPFVLLKGRSFLRNDAQFSQERLQGEGGDCNFPP